MKQLRTILAMVLCTAYYFSAAQSYAGHPEQSLTCKTFFADEQPLEIRMVTDFKKIRSDKKKGVYQNATVTFYFSPADSITETIKLFARGEYRRQICKMPSLMVNFKTSDTSKLKHLKKMKMVCGCSSASQDEELVLMEFLAYKIYNLLTDFSFRVKLAKFDYKDVSDKMKAYTQYGFFIEDVDELGKRNGCREYQSKTAQTQFTNRSQMNLVDLFQYMIGNTDWSVPNYHNIKMVRSVADTLLPAYTIPYDFDFSGLVNASYAFPHEDFGIQKVTDRLYRGFPRTESELEISLRLFRSKKEEIYSLIKNFEPLHKNKRDWMIRYLDDFYNTIDNHKMAKYLFIDGARRE